MALVGRALGALLGGRAQSLTAAAALRVLAARGSLVGCGRLSLALGATVRSTVPSSNRGLGLSRDQGCEVPVIDGSREENIQGRVAVVPDLVLEGVGELPAHLLLEEVDSLEVAGGGDVEELMSAVLSLAKNVLPDSLGGPESGDQVPVLQTELRHLILDESVVVLTVAATLSYGSVEAVTVPLDFDVLKSRDGSLLLVG